MKKRKNPSTRVYPAAHLTKRKRVKRKATLRKRKKFEVHYRKGNTRGAKRFTTEVQARRFANSMRKKRYSVKLYW